MTPAQLEVAISHADAYCRDKLGYGKSNMTFIQVRGGRESGREGGPGGREGGRAGGMVVASGRGWCVCGGGAGDPGCVVGMLSGRGCLQSREGGGGGRDGCEEPALQGYAFARMFAPCLRHRHPHHAHPTATCPRARSSTWTGPV